MDIILLLALFAEQELTSRNCSNLIQLSFSSSGFFSSGNRLRKIGNSDNSRKVRYLMMKGLKVRCLMMKGLKVMCLMMMCLIVSCGSEFVQCVVTG